MSARVDQEVKKHLDAMYRELVMHEVSAARPQRGTRALNCFDSRLFTADETAGELDREKILQPRRLSLRVF